MKKIKSFLIVMMLGLGLYAQSDSEPLIWAEAMPEFKDGSSGINNFIAQNIVYPQEALNTGVEGKVYLRFVVTKSGSVGKVELVRSSGNKYLDNEAIRVIKMLPDFTPGKQNGQAVDVWYSQPIDFKLNSNSKGKSSSANKSNKGKTSSASKTSKGKRQ